MMEFYLSIGSSWILHPLIIILAFSTIYFVKCSKKAKPPPKSLRATGSQGGNVKSNIKSIHPASNSKVLSSAPKSKTNISEIKSKQSVAAGGESVIKKQKDKTRTKDTEEKVPDEDYGEIPEPTASAKKRRQQQLEKDKKEKIQKGFYQSKSDDDDTLDPIKSLKQERTEESTKKSSKKKPKT
uniref:Uncharacterized protein n=1 Tax=Panagrolaimus sp. PS1159 TaxID=55785 RepID=A0AC35FRZ2_9BILA